MTKRTYINAGDELIVQGSLIVEGQLIQHQHTQTNVFEETHFEGETLIINKGGQKLDGAIMVDTNGQLRLESGTFQSNLTFRKDRAYSITNGSAINQMIVSDTSVEAPSLHLTAGGTINHTKGNVLAPSTAQFDGYALSAHSLSAPFYMDFTSPDFKKSDTTQWQWRIADDRVDLNIELVIQNGLLIVSPATTKSIGAANKSLSLTVNNKGIVTAASEQMISILHSQVSDWQPAVRAELSVNDTGGDGSLTYNSTSGVFTYTGPSAAEVRAHFTGGYGITYNQSIGDFAIDINETVSISDAQTIIGAKTFTGNVTFDTPAALFQVNRNVGITGNVAITGDLTVTGTQTIVNTEVINLADNIITLNSNAVGTPTENAGFEIERGTSNNVSFLWDEGINRWVWTNDGLFAWNLAFDDGITYNGTAGYWTADDTVVRTEATRVQTLSGTYTVDGTLNVTGTLVVPFSGSAVEGSIHWDSATNKMYVVDNVGTLIPLTPMYNVGDVESVGSGEISIYAGVRQIGIAGTTNSVEMHGIKTISDDNDIIEITESGNAITVSGVVSNIRNKFSHTNDTNFGNISYTASTGVINFAGVTQQNIRDQFSQGRGISYSAATGVIATTISTENGWKFKTDTITPVDVLFTDTVTIQGSNTVSVTNVGNVITIATTSEADISAVNAGAGLTGGGNFGNVTLNIGQGDGITVNPDSIQVDSTVVRTSGDQTIAGTKSFTGVINVTSATVTGNLIPSANNSYSLGSPTALWEDLYIGPNSLWMNGTQVLSDNTGVITLRSDGTDDISIQTQGGDIDINAGGGTVFIKSNVDILGGSIISTSNGTALEVTSDIDVNGKKVIGLATPTANTDAATKLYVDTRVAEGTITGDRTFDGNVIVEGDLTVNGTVTTINTEVVTIADNIIDLNSNFTSGIPTEDAGIRVIRGDETNATLLWNETANQWEIFNGTTTTKIALSTSDLAEGTNLYFTNERVDDRVSSLVQNGTNISWTYNDVANTLTANHQTFTTSTTPQTAVSPGYGGNFTAVTGFTFSNGHITDVKTTQINFPAADDTNTTDWRVANSGGTEQFAISAAEQVRFAASGAASVSFTPATQTITYSAVNTTYSAGTGLSLAGTTFNHSNSITAGTASGTNGAVGYGGTITIPSITYDAQGHITGTGTTTVTLPSADDTNTTYSISSETGTGGTNLRLTSSAATTDNVLFANGTSMSIARTDANTITINHANVPPAAGNAAGSSGTLTYGGSFTVPYVTYNAQGHVTASGTTTYTLPASDNTNTTYSAGTDITITGASNAINVTSATAATANTIAKRDASGNLTANIFNGTATSARYADLAEKYVTDADYEPGTVVVFGGEAEVTQCTEASDHRVVGVISTDPAYMMNSEAQGQYVALRGRVPVKVTGPVRKGDILVTSDVPGHAQAGNPDVAASRIIGKAIGSKGDWGLGIIEVLI